MLLAFIRGIILLNKQKEVLAKSTTPITVIVAMRNEADNIQCFLKSLLAQKYPEDKYEIIIVNDHSTDGSSKIAMNFQDKHKNLSVLNLPPEKTGKKQAIAHGVRMAKTDHVVFTDADCTHPISWLSEVASTFNQNCNTMLIGPVMLQPAKSLFEMMQALEHASLTASSLGACAVGFPIMASSANLAINQKELNFGINLLNPSQPSGDDVFLLHSAKRKKNLNIGCIHSPKALVTSKPVNTLRDFIKQRARWASKATAYRDWQTVLVGLTVLLYNLMLLIIIIISTFNSAGWLMLGVGIGLKSLLDFTLLNRYLKKYNKINLLKVFIPLQLIYPFYICASFLISVFGNVSWKGRTKHRLL